MIFLSQISNSEKAWISNHLQNSSNGSGRISLNTFYQPFFYHKFMIMLYMAVKIYILFVVKITAMLKQSMRHF